MSLIMECVGGRFATETQRTQRGIIFIVGGNCQRDSRFAPMQNADCKVQIAGVGFCPR
jgi:hypothetical protein